VCVFGGGELQLVLHGPQAGLVYMPYATTAAAEDGPLAVSWGFTAVPTPACPPLLLRLLEDAIKDGLLPAHAATVRAALGLATAWVCGAGPQTRGGERAEAPRGLPLLERARGALAWAARTTAQADPHACLHAVRHAAGSGLAPSDGSSHDDVSAVWAQALHECAAAAAERGGGGGGGAAALFLSLAVEAIVIADPTVMADAAAWQQTAGTPASQLPHREKQGKA
jgi:hypothetical protein